MVSLLHSEQDSVVVTEKFYNPGVVYITITYCSSCKCLNLIALGEYQLVCQTIDP